LITSETGGTKEPNKERNFAEMAGEFVQVGRMKWGRGLYRIPWLNIDPLNRILRKEPAEVIQS